MANKANPIDSKLANKKGLCEARIYNIPKEVWKAARIKAFQEDQKINTVIVELITKWVNEKIDRTS